VSILETFKPFNFDEGAPYASITSNGITFNKSVVMKLGAPEYVQFLVDDNSNRVAVRVCSSEDPNATQFYRHRGDKISSVRWNSKDLLNTIQCMMGWNLKNGGFRVDGTLLKAEGAMLFDLNLATELK
jgi:hypothetical protein